MHFKALTYDTSNNETAPIFCREDISILLCYPTVRHRSISDRYTSTLFTQYLLEGYHVYSSELYSMKGTRVNLLMNRPIDKI